jgi:hypothetical protein
MNWRTRHLPPLLAVAGVVTVAAAVVGWLTAGGPGAAGAAAGVAIVTAGYLLSTVVIARADAASPMLVLPVGLMAYVLKLTLVGGALLVVAQTDWPGLVPMAYGVVAGVVCWSAAQIWWFVGPGRAVAGPVRVPEQAASPDESDSRPRSGQSPIPGE